MPSNGLLLRLLLAADPWYAMCRYYYIRAPLPPHPFIRTEFLIFLMGVFFIELIILLSLSLPFLCLPDQTF